MKTLKYIISFLFIGAFSIPHMAQITVEGKNVSAGKIISAIIKNTGANEIPNTIDVIKEGNPATPVTGIVTTMFATMDVLKEAVKVVHQH